ncbi:MAG: hypothetical protein Q7T80_05985 [Methanoregula sp.]|nr:hypothetical protein [Methanoregula sp.]
MYNTKREMGSTVFLTGILLVLVCQVIPGISAAALPNTPQITPFVTYPDISVTNGSLANHTLPSEYLATPTLLKVQVELPDTALPASKGEMAAGPRAIGFSMDPASLVIAIMVMVIVAAGIGYFLKRKRDEEERE